MNLNEMIEPMHGWCTPEKAELLKELVIKSNSNLSVELGVFGGRSLVAIAEGHKELGFGVSIGFDPFKKDAALEGVNAEANNDWWEKLNLNEIYKSCMSFIDSYHLSDYAQVLRMKSAQAGVLFADESIDLLHQDSNHSEEITCMEVELFTPKIAQGGYWISDDTNWETTQKSLSLLVSKGFKEIKDSGTYKVFQKI